MIKLIIFFIIISSSFMIGCDFSKKYTKRREQLYAITRILYKLKNEIFLKQTTVYEALLCSATTNCKVINDVIIKAVNESSNKGTDLKTAFADFLNNPEIYIDTEDKNVLISLISTLGASTVDEEICKINKSLEILEGNLKNASENETKYVKLFKTGGLLGGILIAIILA